jgi:hypothetical protein
MAMARLCKAKTGRASVFAAHDLTFAHFRKQAMSASEYLQWSRYSAIGFAEQQTASRFENNIFWYVAVRDLIRRAFK